MSIDDKIFLRSIEILAQDMANKPIQEERQKTADDIKQLIEDYITQTTK